MSIKFTEIATLCSNDNLKFIIDILGRLGFSFSDNELSFRPDIKRDLGDFIDCVRDKNDIFGNYVFLGNINELVEEYTPKDINDDITRIIYGLIPGLFVIKGRDILNDRFLSEDGDLKISYKNYLTFFRNMPCSSSIGGFDRQFLDCLYKDEEKVGGYSAKELLEVFYKLANDKIDLMDE